MSKRAKLVMVFVLMAVLVAGLLAFSIPASAHTKGLTEKHDVQCEDVNPWVKTNFTTVITFFSANICYDGTKVWTNRVDCNLVAIGGTAVNTWCGTDVNNGSVVEFGNNFTFTPWGGWFQVFGSSRLQYNADGNRIM